VENLRCEVVQDQPSATELLQDQEDFRRKKPHLQTVSIEGVDVEVVRSYKYLGLQLDDKLDWTANMDTVHRKGQSSLYFLRRLGFLNNLYKNKLLQMFY